MAPVQYTSRAVGEIDLIIRLQTTHENMPMMRRRGTCHCWWWWGGNVASATYNNWNLKNVRIYVPRKQLELEKC
jgi:hypothetical protein